MERRPAAGQGLNRCRSSALSVQLVWWHRPPRQWRPVRLQAVVLRPLTLAARLRPGALRLVHRFAASFRRCFAASSQRNQTPRKNLRSSGHRLPTDPSQRRHICRNRSMGPRLDRHPSDDAVAHHHGAGLAVRKLGAPPAHRRLESLTVPRCRKFGRIELSAISSTAGGADITGLGSLGRHLQS